jgi:hypothetical protein
MTHHTQTKHSTQNYTNNKGHTTHNECKANTIRATTKKININVVMRFTVKFLSFVSSYTQFCKSLYSYCPSRYKILCRLPRSKFQVFPSLVSVGISEKFFIVEFLFLKLQSMPFLIWCAIVHTLDSKDVGCIPASRKPVICVTSELHANEESDVTWC